jgi:hypothetical protein
VKTSENHASRFALASSSPSPKEGSYSRRTIAAVNTPESERFVLSPTSPQPGDLSVLGRVESARLGSTEELES